MVIRRARTCSSVDQLEVALVVAGTCCSSAAGEGVDAAPPEAEAERIGGRFDDA